MKSIEQTILEIYKKDCVYDYFGKNIDIDNINRDYILENLNTHDKALLIKKLETFEEYHTAETEEKGVIKLVCDRKIKDEQRFNNLLDFYGYYITKTDCILNKQCIYFVYFICPKYSKNCSDFIYGDCHGVCYHLCLTDNVEDILKSGLRWKTPAYRYFPKRIYVIAVPVKEIKHIKRIVADVFSELNIKDISKYSILKISKSPYNKTGPDFYQDDAMDSPYTFFTYTNIPPQEIKNLGKLTDWLRK